MSDAKDAKQAFEDNLLWEAKQMVRTIRRAVGFEIAQRIAQHIDKPNAADEMLKEAKAMIEETT